MRISTKGRYGLRAMVDLVVNSNGDHMALKNIAERQDISENYLEQVFSTLRKAGLVKSIKGAQGGYILGEDASKITVGGILRALEGSLSIIDEDSENNNQNDMIEYFLKNRVWEKINETINNMVDSVTLEDLVAEYRKLKGNTSLMFYI